MSSTELIVPEKSHETIVKRTFDAPAQALWDAYTTKEGITAWWGFHGVEIDDFNPAFGGTWRFLEKDKEGNEYAFRGVYTYLDEPKCIVNTFEWEGMPGHICLETNVFEEKDGKTYLTNTSVFQSVEDRDGMVEMGMEEGIRVGMDKLAQFVENK